MEQEKKFKFKPGDFVYYVDYHDIRRVLIVNIVEPDSYEVIDPKHTKCTFSIMCTEAHDSLIEIYEEKIDKEKTSLSKAFHEYNRNVSYYKKLIKKLKEAKNERNTESYQAG